MTPGTLTITERAIREIRSVPDGGWPGVRGITVVAQIWGGDQLALAGGVVRLLSAALAAATPPQGIEALIPSRPTPIDPPLAPIHERGLSRIAEELLRSLERAARQLAGEATGQRLRADTMDAALAGERRRGSGLDERVQALEKALVLRGRQRDNLRDALDALILEVAHGRAQLGPRTSSPAVEWAQNILAVTPRVVPVPGGPQ